MHLNLYLVLFIILLLQVFLFYFYNKRIVNGKLELEKLREEGEKRYKDLANLLPQLVVELGEDGHFDFINDAGLDFIGYSKYEIKNGLKIFDIIHPDDQKKFLEEFLYLLEGGINKGQEFRIQTKDNKTLFVVLFLKVMDSNEYLKKGLRGFIIDITDRKKLERKVLSAVLETEDKERRRFSEDLHDGLGPLLSTIKLYINQMKSGKVTKTEEQEMFVFANELLDEAISTTRNIANNILPGSIVDNGLIPAVSAFCHHLEQTGSLKVNFIHSVFDRFDINIEINIYRIIIELINNSIKHAYASEININMFIEDGIFNLSYSDDGLGFDIEKSKRGLGLDNIINRAQSLNSEIQFVSVEKGMKFTLKLKLVVENKQIANTDNNIITDNHG
jgi:PAS domain S-box-containing protein